MRNLAPAQARPTVERLLDDEDAGVRKQALQAVTALGISGLEPKMKRISTRDPEKGLRQMAKQGLQRISQVQGASPKGAKPAKAKPAKRAVRRQPKRGKK